MMEPARTGNAAERWAVRTTIAIAPSGVGAVAANATDRWAIRTVHAEGGHARAGACQSTRRAAVAVAAKTRRVAHAAIGLRAGAG